VAKLGRFRKPDLHGDEKVSVFGFSTVTGLKSVQFTHHETVPFWYSFARDFTCTT
jgi:hypothetical protein